MEWPLPKTSATVPFAAASWGCRFGLSVAICGIFNAKSEASKKFIAVLSPFQAKGKLQGSRIVHGRYLTKCRERVRGIRSRSESPVERQRVGVAERVKCFRHRFQTHSLTNSKFAAQAQADVEKIGARAGIAIDEDAVDGGSRSGSLDGIGA